MTDTAAAPTWPAPGSAAIATAVAAAPRADRRVNPSAVSSAVSGPDLGRAPVIARPADVMTPDQEPAVREWPFAWQGNPWRLVGPCLFNAVMTLITVGIYSFWGRTEIRKRLWSSVRLDGEPLVYHGTGLELFKGFLGALVLVLLPLFLVGATMVIAYGQASPNWAFYQLALLAVVYPVLKSLATYRARSYRLARTTWRGVHGSVTGSSAEFAFLSWATSLLYPLTLGWIAPWRALYIQRFLIGDTMLGDRSLHLGGSTPRLYLRFGLLWFATVAIIAVAALGITRSIGPALTALQAKRLPTLTTSQGLEVAAILVAALFVWSALSSFYRSSLYNMIANGTVLLLPDTAPQRRQDAPRFKLATRGLPLLWLFVTNQLITYGSLFVLRPVATARSLRYFANHLVIVGAFDPAQVRQNPNAALREGEGLAQAFDFDAF
jgi:uncharacterized membrane protein YjgN (DUF898 family)